MKTLIYLWSLLDLLWHSAFYPSHVYYFSENETKHMIYNETYWFAGVEYRYLGRGHLLAI